MGTGDGGEQEFSNGATLTAEFDGIVQRWAQILNSHLARLSNRE
jgi:hypothetical protein